MRFVAFSSLALSFIPSLSLFLCLVCLACSLFKSQLFIIFVVLVYCTFSFAFAFIFLWFNWTFWDCNFFFAVLHSLSLTSPSFSLSSFIFALSETLCTIAQFVVVVVVYLTQNSFVVCRVCAEFLFFYESIVKCRLANLYCKFNICFNVCAVLLYV